VSQDGEIIKPGRMRAQPDVPLLDVYALAKFVFCPRAGVITHEAGQDESVNDLGPVKLDYMPRYDLREIEEALQEVKGWLGLWGIGVLATLMLTGVVTYTVHPETLWIGLAVVAGIVCKMAKLFYRAWVLAGRQWACLHAEAKEPDPAATEVQPVNWWELMKAGFRSIKYLETLTDEDRMLSGRLWRVLRRGSLRIPVFRELRGGAKLERHHCVTMAAYCHLLQVCEGGDTPYGIILFGHSYEGVAVPNSPTIKAAFHDALVEAWAAVRKAREDASFPPAPRGAQCEHCPLGWPRVHRLGETEHATRLEMLPVFPGYGGDGRPYHSFCGDRFHWIPPHERAKEKELK